MTLTCQCCGFSREFTDGEHAFREGWDAPPHFTSIICCDLCPAVCIIAGRSHKKAHDRWDRLGRPREFTVAGCGADEHISDAW